MVRACRLANLREAEEMDRASGRRRRLRTGHPLHGVLRERLEILLADAIELGPLAVRLARDVEKHGPLCPLHQSMKRIGAGQAELVLQPRLNQGILPGVFVIAQQQADAVGQVPRPAAGEPGERAALQLQIAVKGARSASLLSSSTDRTIKR